MTRETEVGREGKVLSDKQLNRLVMESGKSPSKGFQNRLDQCHLLLGKKILLGTRACSRWHPEIPSSPISFYVSMILSRSSPFMERRYGCYYTSPCFHLLLGDELMLQLGLPQEITQLDMHNF